MKFVEAILSNNTTDDHCREFIAQKGLEPLMKILGLPNLPIEFPTAPSCQAVSSVCKSVLVRAFIISYRLKTHQKSEYISCNEIYNTEIYQLCFVFSLALLSTLHV